MGRVSGMARQECITLCLPGWPFAQDGDTPLHIAAWFGHVDVVRVLLAAGANKDARNEVCVKEYMHIEHCI